MPLLIPSFDEIRQTILNDIISLNKGADIGIDSDYYVRASSLAALGEGLYGHQAWVVRQIFADTADREFLEQHAAKRDIYRKVAVKAEGIATKVSGEKGNIIPVGSEIKIKKSDYYFLTTNEVVLSDKPVEIYVTAKIAGSKSNFVLGEEAIFTAAPIGVRSECFITSRGGTDVESDAELLARYLEYIRRPPAGGNKYDYRKWAMEVPGVKEAFVYPLRRGLGTIDIAITAGDDIPSDSVIQTTQDYIDDVRPVTAKHSYVVAPSIERIDIEVEVSLQGVKIEEVRINTQVALDDHFLRVAPGETLILSQIEALISDQIGVIDRNLISPTKNLEPNPELIHWYRLGRLIMREIK